MERTHDRPMAGRTVLVTGATSGIGPATVLALATMGGDQTIAAQFWEFSAHLVGLTATPRV